MLIEASLQAFIPNGLYIMTRCPEDSLDSLPEVFVEFELHPVALVGIST
jgi:hypothetical protein